MKPRIAVVSFPGTNGDTENLRALSRNGMDAFVFRWNDSREKLEGVDGYFIGAGFSYEDRGRSGMVAGRDPIFQFLHEEARKGKVVVGNCNGCQVLVESELIPVGSGLKMCLARNLQGDEAVGFLNEWVWVTPTCAKDRCAVSNWGEVMQIPIAHGEGRFVTKDKDMIEELQSNDQIALCYCNARGDVADAFNPNGSLLGAAAICNSAGNVVACMPHPERTVYGDPYFQSMRMWIENHKPTTYHLPPPTSSTEKELQLPRRPSKALEIFIDTLIVNNEERTVEQAARRIIPTLELRQLRYLAPAKREPKDILSHFSVFNPNKEVAYVRRGKNWAMWNADAKKEESVESVFNGGIALLRRDEPDTGAAALEEGSETGVCYVCLNVDQRALNDRKVQEIFANPQASTLEKML